MAVTVGTLTIDLKANTASFSGSMDKMSQLSAKTASDVKRSLDKIATAGLAMAAAIAGGTAGIIVHALGAADSLGKLAQSAGTTTETLSVLNYAASLSNVSTEDLGKGLEKLSKSAFAAQNGNKELAKVFSKLGVSTADASGHLRDSGLVLGDVATKFAGFQDGAGKTALAMTLFGRAGAGLIPLLNQYGTEQAKVNDEAHRFGLVLSTSTSQVAAEAHDNLDRLQAVLKGLGYSLLSATLPAISKLSEQLVQLAKDADIPDLAKSFGAHVTAAIDDLGGALAFAAKHAQALKIALGALAGIQLAKIALPFAVEIFTSGSLAAGVGKFVTSFLGLGKVLPLFAQFGSWLSYTAKFLGLVAGEEGVAAAGAFGLGTAVTAIGGPFTIAAAAVIGLGFGIYKFRDATFSLQGTSYELRDVWSAAWIAMGKAMDNVRNIFAPLVDWMKKVWSGFTTWFGTISFVSTFKKWFNDALGWAQGVLGKLTPQWAIDSLNQAKKQREDSVKPPAPPPLAPVQKPLPMIDTRGLGPQQKDPYGDEIKKLDLLIASQRAYYAVLDQGPDAIQSVANAEAAEVILLDLRKKLLEDSLPAMTKLQEATIKHKLAIGEDQKAINAFTTGLISQEQSVDLATQQTRALAVANLLGEAAVRKATIANTLLGLSFNKTSAETQKFLEMQPQLEAMLTAKAAADLTASSNLETRALEQELQALKLVTAATLGTVEAQRQADLAAKLLAIDHEIADANDAQILASLQKKRQAIIDLNTAQQLQADLQAAVALKSPEEQYTIEIDAIKRATAALAASQQGVVTYGQVMMITGKQVDAFNKLTDAEVDRLLRLGTAGSGVKAFFLDMQKQAQTTGSIVFDALKSSFDKVADSLTALITTGKADFGKMFEDLGKQVISSTIKQQMQKGLAALGSKFGVALKADGTQENPFWVQTKNALLGAGDKDKVNGQSTGSAVQQILGILQTNQTNPTGSAEYPFYVIVTNTGAGGGAPSALSTGLSQIFGGLMGGLSGLFGGGGGSDTSVSSSWSPDSATPASSSKISDVWGALPSAPAFGGKRSGGGQVSPDMAYLVGEDGPELLSGASGSVTSSAKTRRVLGGNASNHYYTIDARGTDPVLTEQRTRAGIMAAHNSAVVTSVQVQADRLKRSPQRN